MRTTCRLRGEIDNSGRTGVALPRLGLPGWRELQTEALSSAVDAMASNFPGFYFGRFDVRASTSWTCRPAASKSSN